jgi:hypothetical protein
LGEVLARCANAEVVVPASYTIIVERKLVISRAWGAVTDDDVREHARMLLADPLFDPNFRQLVDMSGITEDLVGTTTKQQASHHQLFAPGVRRAWVASKAYSFGMARMYAVAAENQGQNVRVFRERSEAEAWLAL